MNNVIKFAYCSWPSINKCEGVGPGKFVCESKGEKDWTCVNLFTEEVRASYKANFGQVC